MEGQVTSILFHCFLLKEQTFKLRTVQEVTNNSVYREKDITVCLVNEYSTCVMGRALEQAYLHDNQSSDLMQWTKETGIIYIPHAGSFPLLLHMPGHTPCIDFPS